MTITDKKARAAANMKLRDDQYLLPLFVSRSMKGFSGQNCLDCLPSPVITHDHSLSQVTVHAHQLSWVTLGDH